jgi:hypothetical protein
MTPQARFERMVKESCMDEYDQAKAVQFFLREHRRVVRLVKGQRKKAEGEQTKAINRKDKDAHEYWFHRIRACDDLLTALGEGKGKR